MRNLKMQRYNRKVIKVLMVLSLLVSMFIIEGKDISVSAGDTNFNPVTISNGAKIYFGGKSTTYVDTNKVMANTTSANVNNANINTTLNSFINTYYSSDVTALSNAQLPSMANITSWSGLETVAGKYWLSNTGTTTKESIPYRAYAKANNTFDSSLGHYISGQSGNVKYDNENILTGSYDYTTNKTFSNYTIPSSFELTNNSSDTARITISNDNDHGQPIGHGVQWEGNPNFKDIPGIAGYSQPNLTGASTSWNYSSSVVAETRIKFRVLDGRYLVPLTIGETIAKGETVASFSQNTGNMWTNPSVLYYQTNSEYHGGKYFYLVFFKAPVKATVVGKDSAYDVSYNGNAKGIKYNPGKTVNGTSIVAASNSVRPVMNLDTNQIAFARDRNDTSRTISPILGSLPISSLVNNGNYKLVLKNNTININDLDKTKKATTTSKTGDIKDANIKDGNIIEVLPGTDSITIPVSTIGNPNIISTLTTNLAGTARYGKIGTVSSNSSNITIKLSDLIDTDVVGEKTISLYAETINGVNTSDYISTNGKDITIKVINEQKIDFTTSSKEQLNDTEYIYGDEFELTAEVTEPGLNGPEMTMPITFTTNTDYIKQVGTTNWREDGDSVARATAKFKVVRPGTNEEVVVKINKEAKEDDDGNTIFSKATEVSSTSVITRKRKISLKPDAKSARETEVMPELTLSSFSKEEIKKKVLQGVLDEDKDTIPYKVITKYLTGNMDPLQDDIPLVDGKISPMASGNIWKLVLAEDTDTYTQDQIDLFKAKYDIQFEENIIDVYDKKGNFEDIYQERIYANNFMMSTEEYMELAEKGQSEIDKALIKRSGAKAISTIDNADVDIVLVENHIEEHAEYEVVFKTAKGSQIIVIGTIKDNIINNILNRERISANNSIISIEEAKIITNSKNNSELIKLANVEATNTKTGAIVDITEVEHNIEAKKGIYNVTFKTEKGTKLTVEAKVTDTSYEDNDERITANNIHLSKEEAQNILDTDSKHLIELAGVEAINIKTGAAVEITEINHNLEAKKGENDVIFKTEKGTTLTIEAKVTDASYEDNDERITANHITLSKEEAQNILDTDSKQLIELSSVEAINIKTGAIVEITEVEHDIEAKKGVYDVIFKTEKGTTLTIEAKVTDASYEDNDERITANHIVLSKEEAQSILDTGSKELIRIASAEAVNTKTGEFVEIAEVDHNIEARRGMYNVTFKTEKGTELIVDAKVTDKTVEENNERITANNIILSKEEAQTILDTDNKELIRIANVEATDTKTGKVVEITEVDHNIEAKRGTYDVTFKTKKGTTLTIEAKVTDISDEANGERICANNIYLSIEEAQAIIDTDNTQLIRLANVEAFDVYTGEQQNITDIDHNIKAEKGIYEVVFKTEKGTKVTIIAVVTDNSIENDINKERITGNDIDFSYQEIVDLLNKSSQEIDNKLKELSEVQAVSTETGEIVEITKATHTIQTKEGVYNTTFSTEKGTALTVSVKVGKGPTISTNRSINKTGDNLRYQQYTVYLAISIILITLIAKKTRKHKEV
ncbi:MAG: hypothetical protein ACK5LC_16720 [Coprobacillaceae bacterium]